MLVRSIFKTSLTLVAITALGACSADPSTHVSSKSPVQVGTMDALVNGERTSKGMPTISRSARLDAAAFAHGQDMAEKNFFSHVSSDGSRLASRVARQGYGACFAAENIGWGSPYASPDAMMAGWMASPGHRQNILASKATEFGYAKVNDPDGSHDPLWVMVFGRPGC
jgi:uncharacterized protein YkwD